MSAAPSTTPAAVGDQHPGQLADRGGLAGAVDPDDEVLLVLDATIGQNSLPQARVFAEVVDITGVVLTKLDGTAKGGIVFRVRPELGGPGEARRPGGGTRRSGPIRARGIRQRTSLLTLARPNPRAANPVM